jgi:hypothetical protein
MYASSGIRTHDPNVRASEGGSCLRPRGYCDRLVTYNNTWKLKVGRRWRYKRSACCELAWSLARLVCCLPVRNGAGNHGPEPKTVTVLWACCCLIGTLTAIQTLQHLTQLTTSQSAGQSLRRWVSSISRLRCVVALFVTSHSGSDQFCQNQKLNYVSSWTLSSYFGCPGLRFLIWKSCIFMELLCDFPGRLWESTMLRLRLYHSILFPIYRS